MNISDTLIDSISADTQTFINWLKTFEIEVDDNLLIAGPFLSPEYPVWPRFHDNFHYPLGMRKLLRLGFTGIRDLAFENAGKSTGNDREYLIQISNCYNEIIKIIELFSEKAREKNRQDIYQSCYNLTKNPPSNFLEACQLYWFATIFRIGTSTIGRIDQHLHPFYRIGIQKGNHDFSSAEKLVSELLYRYEKRGANKGDTLQNATLGGRDYSGLDCTNDLTYMILNLVIKNRYIEPKINVRLHKNSPDKIFMLIAELQNQGSGICTIFNDDIIIDGLIEYRRPPEVASDYCADGCTEIILDGWGATWFRYIDCVKAVEHVLFSGEENLPEKKVMQYYSAEQESLSVKPPVEKGLKTKSFADITSYQDFYETYLSQLEYQVATVLKEPYSSDEYPMRLFTAATMPGVFEEVKEPYTSEFCYHTFGLFTGSIGAAANSIASVKYLLYDQKVTRPEELLNALRDNFENYPELKRICEDTPKFGNDENYVDEIVADIALKFAMYVRKYKDQSGKPILPGLYNHLFHHTAYSVGATPDGRKYGDPLGEHLSPTPGTAKKGPTAIINSVSKVNTKEQVFGSTLHLNIPRISLGGGDVVTSILTSLNKAFCQKSGCVLNINILDANMLKDAQLHPEKYQDLIVRVWGFSYYFTKLSKEMQDHVIARSNTI